MTRPEPDSQAGDYYVSIVDGRKRSLALGPFAQANPGTEAHAAALAAVALVRSHVRDAGYAGEPWFSYGTARVHREGEPSKGRLNDALAFVPVAFPGRRAP